MTSFEPSARGSIGLVTDSSSQITDELVERYSVTVVPLTVTVDGRDYQEGVDLDADQFYGFFADGHRPDVSTSQPAPGLFAAAYERLAAAGCDEIVSVHVGSTMSGTVSSASMAASHAPVPVHVIDSRTASFGVAACVWSAGETIRRGGNVDDIQRRVGALLPDIGSAFVAGVPLLTERGGRAPGVEFDGDGVPVLVIEEGKLVVAERVDTIDDLVDVVAGYAAGWRDEVVVAIGTADEPSRPISTRLAAALHGAPSVRSIVDYRIGPTIGAHTGPGTFGLMVFPPPAATPTP